MKIAVYISGHGFGHLAQLAPVLNRIHAIRPECRFLIRCSLPQTEIRARLNFDVEIEASEVDIGVVQKNAIEEDRDASLIRMKLWVEQMDARVDQEIRLLRRFNPSLVLSNISPLAFPVASALGVPGIGLATLDWHTIYSHWIPADDPLIQSLAEAYRACDLLLTPPMAMDMPVFPVQRRIDLIATHPVDISNPVAGDRRKKALVLFGGCAHPPYDSQALASMDDWLFLIPDAGDAGPENITGICFGPEMRPVDLMPFVDVVVCKPGYGVLSECWCTATPIAWVERPDFPEFPMLKRWLDTSMPAAGMSRADFRHGRWQSALQAALHHPCSFPSTSADGADAAANIILSHISR
ncbi:MAG: hypothetical protein Q9M12_08900 [Mariprofundus sp.]|nr:hypothetical protein [Mariprofundus sp.]